MNLPPRSLAITLRKLGWLTLLAFTVKGIATTTLILWALGQAVP